jgi:REP element-mobilizing transposase RayT
MDSPLGYFLTWTAYGTWLPGDERGWVDGATHEMHFSPDAERAKAARARMTENAITLDGDQRQLVERTIGDHCRIRGWQLHAVNARTTHVHAVVALDGTPEKALRELKAWTTRRLKEVYPGRETWWTEKGSRRYLWTEDALESAIRYVLEMQ